MEKVTCGQMLLQGFLKDLSLALYYSESIAMIHQIFFKLLYLESVFLSVAYLTVVKLARLGISVRC